MLNLPQRVAGGGQEIQYVYDATGAKLAKTGSGGTEYYAGAMVYDETDLSYLMHDEGMVRIGHSGEARSYTYFYHLKDHLGNTRVEFQANPDNSYQVTQRQSYYPFGLCFEVAPAGENEYLYNGKELQKDLIAGRSLGWYDYGARFYDAALGRWHVQDPLAEKRINITPYNYVSNNPVLRIDLDGRLDGDYYDKELNKIGTDGIDDGKRYLVKDKGDQEHIKCNDAKGDVTYREELYTDVVTLPDDQLIIAMSDATDASNSPSIEANDAKGGFHEEGGTYGIDGSGNTMVVPSKPGQAGTFESGSVSVNNFDAADPSAVTSDYVMSGTYHVHPSGTQGNRYWKQRPTGTDKRNARVLARTPKSFTNGRVINGNHYVIGANNDRMIGGNRVYIYNSRNGSVASVPRDKLFNLVGK